MILTERGEQVIYTYDDVKARVEPYYDLDLHSQILRNVRRDPLEGQRHFDFAQWEACLHRAVLCLLHEIMQRLHDMLPQTAFRITDAWSRSAVLVASPDFGTLLDERPPIDRFVMQRLRQWTATSFRW